ncbi:DUF6776 family protein [Cognatilysobacter segetis]|uniref:DUF6776 family protein n=1 Tax=Cognatilysobacter segetis TaxID=2492394 RepID=UPI001EE44389|nr:DUF6776 family protein [Lysobacter segetis]
MATPPTPPHAARAGIGLIAALLVFLLALLFGAWGVWQVARSTHAPACDAGANDELAQRVTTLARSDQVSREANTRLQATLAEREEQIAQLRADVDFYERLVGATGQRHGLTVHALRMSRQPGGAWHFTAGLTQNLDRGGVSSGTVELAVEGSEQGRLRTLDWAALRQQPRAAGVPYSVRYFEEVQGDVFLPAGFTPSRVLVRLHPRGGGTVEHAVTWADATAAGAANP